ncbi:MAG: 30S ribosomal protein S6 [Candidatus Marinimicrobia bacterium]|nr:30S ribosomal protein S6 [Candidatus Neomarinimicrobiota bacterium]
MMRDYELVLVIDPEISGIDQKKLIAKIKKIIEELKGKVEKTDEWGKKKFAYPIKKKSLGYYFLLMVKLPAEAPREIEKQFKLEEKLIRYLLVKKE